MTKFKRGSGCRRCGFDFRIPMGGRLKGNPPCNVWYLAVLAFTLYMILVKS